jgi:hypothetical protein
VPVPVTDGQSLLLAELQKPQLPYRRLQLEQALRECGPGGMCTPLSRARAAAEAAAQADPLMEAFAAFNAQQGLAWSDVDPVEERLAKYQRSQEHAAAAASSPRSSQGVEHTAASCGLQQSRGGVMGLGSMHNSTSGISSSIFSGGRKQQPNARIGSPTLRPPSPGHVR